MVLKVYVSRCSGNIKIKTKQEFILRTLNSRHVEYEEIDISDPLQEAEKMHMREHSVAEPGQSVPMPPQIFNDDQYCGDYDCFLDANEVDNLMQFLKLQPEQKVSVANMNLAESAGNLSDSDDGYDGGTAGGEQATRSSDSGLEDDDENRKSAAAAGREGGRGDETDEKEGSLHEYENVVLTRDRDGNTVVQLREDNVPSGDAQLNENHNEHASADTSDIGQM